jgi:hypothetical protein
MAKHPGPAGVAIIAALSGDPTARLVAGEDGNFRLAASGGPGGFLSAATVLSYRTAGLLGEIAPGMFAATPAAAAWLKRRADGERPFRAQHGTLAEKTNGGTRVVVDLDESPIATLARRVGKGGEPWLKPHAVEAAERLRRDFEIGRLQPRVTANWSASVSNGRRAGDGLADLTDMALAARLRFDRAMRAVGPELSGALADVCCFLKGLETLERERLWPARSAKLVLRIALEALARHYGLTATATGRPGSGKLRHWGADDYRPEIA